MKADDQVHEIWVLMYLIDSISVLFLKHVQIVGG